MKHLKQWFLQRFLPLWAEKILEAENAQLQRKLDTMRQKHKELEAYTRGLERALRSKRTHIILQGGECHGRIDAGVV